MTVATPALLDKKGLTEIAMRVGTPVYVYSLSRLRGRIHEIRNALPRQGFRLYFATMANDEPQILRAISAENVGACVNSMRHWELALQCGFSDSDIQFTSSGISTDAMRRLAQAGVVCNLDSQSQVERWFSAGGRTAGLRLNCGAVTGLAESDSDRLGMDLDTARSILRQSKWGDAIVGVHMYAGTNILNAPELVRRLACLFEFAAEVASLQYINIGGGIGVDYTRRLGSFDLAYFGQCIGALADRLRDRLGRDVEIIFEPGRALIADSGVFVTRVTDVKSLRGIKYAAVDGSVALFPRPLHHPKETHLVIPLHETDGPASHSKYTVVGKTTFSRDILGQAELNGSLSSGDLLAFYDAGAYSRSMASRFLGQDDPEIYVID